MTIEIHLRELREAKGMSYRALARESGVSLSQLQKIESGFAKNPRCLTLCQLAFALDTSLDRLITYKM